MQHHTSDQLIDYLHGELDAATDARVHEHLLECEPCRGTLEGEARLGEWLRRSAAAAERELPGQIETRVWAAVRRRSPSFADRLRAVLRPVIAVPFGVGLAALAFVALPALHTASVVPAPTVAASFYLDEHAADGQENPLADHPIGAAVVTSATNE
jgi:predicted anti-sigma-YlaC factor YlaD